MACVRCGSEGPLDRHHIEEQADGGSDDETNLEDRCVPCHYYEHAWRKVAADLAYEHTRGQADRIQVFQHRLAVLDAHNTPEQIRERGSYVSYWQDRTTHYLPRPIPTKHEAEVDSMIQLALEGAAEEYEQRPQGGEQDGGR